ncbi:hypothetical protein CCR75_001587 [Bremia lactucae]|uniref:LTD domain-containing protein n=1 Tax=Bremia lactucae TaxID=4779 RepID=A0A976FH45_BRELC|nr:hypothetical protein CCR75_001587 [Bremia lactucae]
MSYSLQRRLPLASLDQQVARASMQICHKIVMQQLYLSRIDASKQWVVVSNPSDVCVDLTGFSLHCSNTNDIFYFPPKYTLLQGDEVTVWCSPGSLKLDEDYLRQPYLFWTNTTGTLRHLPFDFSTTQAYEVFLFDPLLVEVASIYVSADGNTEFRVLHCKSTHLRTVRSDIINPRFCAGCLSPPEFKKQTSWPTFKKTIFSTSSYPREIYIFSSYWGVVSNKSLLKHFLAILLVPLMESIRAVLIYFLFIMCQPLSKNERRPQLLSRIMTLVFMILTCDIIARRLLLSIKSGFLVTIANFTSIVLDQAAALGLYRSLQVVYPLLSTLFDYMLRLDLGVSCINAAAVHVRFLNARCHWHPLLKQCARLEHKYRAFFCTCGIGRALLLHLLLLLPLSSHPSRLWKFVGYLLVPLFTVASGVDFIRALAIISHMFQCIIKHFHVQVHNVPSQSSKQLQQVSKYEQDVTSQIETPSIIYSTPKKFRFRSRCR